MTLESLALKMHEARREVLRLKKERRALDCERVKVRWRTGERNPDGTQDEPCWKLTVEVDIGHGHELQPTGGNDSDYWCASCRKRELVHLALRKLAPELGHIKRAFWRMAARLATSPDKDEVG